MSQGAITGVLTTAIHDTERAATAKPVDSVSYNNLISGSGLSQMQLGCILAKGNVPECNIDSFGSAHVAAHLVQLI